MAKKKAAVEGSSSSVVAFSDSSRALPTDVGNLLDKMRVSAASFKNSHVALAQSAGAGIQSAPAELGSIVADLNRWEIQVHKYKDQTAAKAGFLGFGGVEAQLLKAGLVHEAKRFLVRKTENDRRVEFGVAVRLWVAVTEFKFSAELTVPNLAASAQLAQSNATIGLTVSGFIGALGDMLPSPQSLDVENYSIYLDAFKNIQAHVFGNDGEAKLSPVMLGYHKLDGE